MTVIVNALLIFFIISMISWESSVPQMPQPLEPSYPGRSHTHHNLTPWSTFLHSQNNPSLRSWTYTFSNPCRHFCGVTESHPKDYLLSAAFLPSLHLRSPFSVSPSLTRTLWKFQILLPCTEQLQENPWLWVLVPPRTSSVTLAQSLTLS